MTPARDRQQPKSSMERTPVVLLLQQLLVAMLVLRIGFLALAMEAMIAVDSSPVMDRMPDHGERKMATGGGGEGGWGRIRSPGGGRHRTDASRSDIHSRSKDFGGSPSEGRLRLHSRHGHELRTIHPWVGSKIYIFMVSWAG